MQKEKLSKKGKEAFLKLIEKVYNNFVFGEFWEDGISPEELFEEMSYRGENPKVLTETAVMRLIVSFIDGEEEMSQLGLRIKDIRDLVKLAEAEKILKKWGEGKKLLVTKMFLDCLDVWDDSFSADIISADGEEVFERNITLECPYCYKQTKISTKDGYSNVECDNCGKEFKLLTGKVKKTRGRLTAVVQYGAEPISITIGVGKGEETINFNTNCRVLISRGDKISFIWKKGWLSSDYGESPKQICNWESSEIYKI